MTRQLQLSELVAMVQETIEDRFYNDTFWIRAEITDVKKYESKGWCFLKLVEKQGERIATEMQAVFWSNAYPQIPLFERLTKTVFRDGIEISCRVAVRFHPRYGLKLEVLEIDTRFTLGMMELQRQQTLEKLIRENPQTIRMVDDQFLTLNNQLKLPLVAQRIALVAAPNSDGYRDFCQELEKNAYGYRFLITHFPCQVQGDTAGAQMTQTLLKIRERSSDFDLLVLVRGGGSQTDLGPFDHYELARTIAHFPVPVLTGIGHDRNTSIADLMARQYKVPTKVASAIIDLNFRFETELLQCQNRLEDAVESLLLEKQQSLNHWRQSILIRAPQRVTILKTRLTDWQQNLEINTLRLLKNRQTLLDQSRQNLYQQSQRMLNRRQEQLQNQQRLLQQLSPQNVLNRGYALLMQNGKMITGVEQLSPSFTLHTQLKNGTVDSTVLKIIPHETTEF